jgi:hypothetical protein
MPDSGSSTEAEVIEGKGEKDLPEIVYDFSGAT